MAFQPDSIYNDEVNLANRQYEHATSQLNDQERRFRHEYGIDDPTNPFGRLAELKRTYLNRGGSTGARYAQRGSLYSGARRAALGNVRRGQERDTAALRSSYEQGLAGIRDQRAQLGFAQEASKNTAFQNWLGRQTPPDVDEEAAPAPAVAPGAAKAAGKPSSAALRAAAQRQKARARSNSATAVARARSRRAHPAPNRRQGSGNLRRRRR